MKDNVIENPGKTMWRDAARDGGVIGLILLATMFVNGFAGFKMTTLIGVVNFAALAGCIYIFTRRRSLVYGDSGFSFAQSIGYIIMMMVFAGIITGIGDYAAVNLLWPEYYEGTIDEVFENNPFLAQVSGDVYGQSVAIVRAMLKNPFYHMLNGIMGRVIYGGIIGLFASAFVKRAPQSNTFGNEKQ